MDDAASVEELLHEPGADEPGGSGDAAHPAAHLARCLRLFPGLPVAPVRPVILSGTGEVTSGVLNNV
jgi:hypothetical protein